MASYTTTNAKALLVSYRPLALNLCQAAARAIRRPRSVLRSEVVTVISRRCERKLRSCAACQQHSKLRERQSLNPALLLVRHLNTALRFYPTLLLVLLGALDKAAAKLGLRRVPEQTLCGLAVASGTTGALTGALALVLLQHKTRKQSFQLKYLIATGLALAIDNLL